MKANRDVVPGREKFFHVTFTELTRRNSSSKRTNVSQFCYTTQ